MALMPASAGDQLRAEFSEWEIGISLQGRIWWAYREWNEGRTRRCIVAGSAGELLKKLREVSGHPAA